MQWTNTFPRIILCASLLGLLTPSSWGQPSAAKQAKPPAGTPLVRELFIPFDDLSILLEADKNRVFLGRQEYEELLAKAKQKPADPHAPWSAALLSSHYTIQVLDGRAQITGRFDVEILNDDVHAIPLPMSAVGLRSATWDTSAAPLGRQPDGQVILFGSGKGTHKLVLEFTAPLAESAAQQSLQVQVPQGAVTSLTLFVAGNVELKTGAAVQKRIFDANANETKFELAPPRGSWSLVMSLNNRQKKAERVFVARSVIVDEVTQAYERIHARLAIRVLHGSGDVFRIAIPAGFEVTEVSTPLLSKWTLAQIPTGRVVELTLREPAVETVVVELTAIKTDVDLAGWKFPTLDPLDVAGHVALATVLLEDRLRLGELTTQDAMPIDAATLAAAIPASVMKVEPGSPSVRQVATYYAPQGKFTLQANVLKPTTGLQVVTSSLLLLEDKQLSLRGGFALTPAAEEIFSLGFRVPAGWRILEVTQTDGQPLPMERFPLADGSTRVLVRFAAGLPVGRATSINYTAAAMPQDWFQEWTQKELEFPVITVEGATREQGAVAMHALDDLVIAPGELTNLLPLLESEKANYGFGDLPTTLAFYYEKTPFAAKIKVERPAPSLAADIHEFYQVERDRLGVRYEVNYTIRERRTRELAFWLPKSTPKEISIEGIGVNVKDYSGKEVGDRRLWKVLLAERQGGTAKLAVTFEQTYATEKDTTLTLPQLEADSVDYQSVLMAIENAPELDVEAIRHPRAVDVGELIGAEYELGRRVVGAYGYTGSSAEVKIAVTPHTSYALPTALVQRAELVTIVDPASRGGKGISQSFARFELKTKATLLELELPTKATLWSVVLDGTPTKPQKQGNALLISLPITTAAQTRNLQIVYEAPSSPLGLAGEVQQFAPKLRLPTKQGSEEVLLADLVWRLWLPTGYRVTRTNGSVFTSGVTTPPQPAVRAWEWFGDWLLPIRPQLGYTGIARSYYTFDDLGYESAPKSAARTIAPQMDEYAARAGDLAEGSKSFVAPTAKPEAVESLNKSIDQPQQSFREVPPPQVTAPATPPAPKAPATPAAEPPAEPAKPADPFAAPADAKRPGGKEKDDKPAVQTSEEKGQNQQLATRLWALEGVACLPIELQPTSTQQLEFYSLGSQPELRATLVDSRRISFAAWGAGLITLLVGVSRCCRPRRERLTFLATILGGSSLLALLPGIFRDLLPVFDATFFAGCWVAIFYLLAALCKSTWNMAQRIAPNCCNWCCRVATTVTTTSGTTTSVLLLLLVANFPSAARAQQEVRVADLVQALEGGGPITIPADAVVIPYDPAAEDGLAKAEKILVPYATYVQLWNRANPEKKIPVVKSPVDYSLAGLEYQARLAEGDQLQIDGTWSIQVYNDKPVAIPLILEGGVVASAKVDGQPARLQVVEATPQAATKGKAQIQLPPPMLLLHLTGRGEKKLEISYRLPVQRQGGRRIVNGRLPTGPAAALTLIAPEAGTEVRLPSVPDRQTHETKKADEKIETSLGDLGQLRIEWRPKLAVAMVDQTLTAESLVLLDVREDAVRLAWQVAFQFRGGARESFELGLPADYLVERVTGENIRGWQTRMEGNERRLEIQLLKAAPTKERFTVHLARRQTAAEAVAGKFTAPLIEARGAVLHQGELVVRRSPRLELEIGKTQGLNRADVPAAIQSLAAASEELDSSVMEMRLYQTYRFATTPFVLPLTVRAAQSGATAEIQSLLRMAERSTLLESNLVVRSATPVFKMRVLVPEDLEITAIEPAELEWSTTKKNGKQLVQILFAQGQVGKAQATLRGQWTKQEGNEIAAPTLEVLDVERQEGELVVQADPDVEVKAIELKDSDPVFLMQTIGWLRVEQHTLAKTAIRYRNPNFVAKFLRQPKTPVVTAQSLTNVKITRRAVEETSILNFNVSEAGISELSFLLPAALEKARIKVPLLRQKTITPVAELPGWVRVKLQLQDDRIGQIVVLVEHDRLVTTEKQSVSLPRMETGETRQQLLTFESAGRDEVIIDGHAGLEPLSRQQPGWREAQGVLGEQITQVYAGENDARKSELAFHLQDRALVETSGARIGLAETILIVDASGAYRAVQQYRVENYTQPYLEVQLPAGATLWTATVAGEPVKPSPGKSTELVRIPLVKTAQGEADYGVVLKYGGQMPRPGTLSVVKFPLAQTTNVNAELSQVRLFLPEGQRWFNFDGTMRQVGEGEFAAGLAAYFNKQIDFACKMLTSENPYTQVRARNNLKQLGIAVQTFNSSNSMLRDDTGRLSSLNMANDALLLDSQRQIMEIEQQQQQQVVSDNRDKLNAYFEQQDVQRTKNAVTKLGSNFAAQRGEQAANGEFNGRWLAGNQLQGKTSGSGSGNTLGNLPGGRPNSGPAGVNNPESIPLQQLQQQQRFSRAAPQTKNGKDLSAPNAAQSQTESQGDFQKVPQIPQVTAEKGKKMLQEQLEAQQGLVDRKGEAKQGEETRNLNRYQQKLDQQLDQSGLQQLAQNINPARLGQSGGNANASGNIDSNLNLNQNFRNNANELNQPPVGLTPNNDLQPGTSVTGVGRGDIAGGGFAGNTNFITPVIAGGMASLDVELPQRGQAFFFTKPRGDVEIVARVVSEETIRRSWGLAAVVIVGLLVLVLTYWGLKILPRQLDSLAGDVLLLLAGLGCFVLGWVIFGLLIGMTAVVRIACRLMGQEVTAA